MQPTLVLSRNGPRIVTFAILKREILRWRASFFYVVVANSARNFSPFSSPYRVLKGEKGDCRQSLLARLYVLDSWLYGCCLAN